MSFPVNCVFVLFLLPRVEDAEEGRSSSIIIALPFHPSILETLAVN